MKRPVFNCLVVFWLAWAWPLPGAGIHEAAASGDLEKVRAFLKAEPGSINARRLGTTPLHEAARGGHLEVVKLLVASGARVNEVDSSGLTPLKLAMGYERKEVAAWLRANGGLDKVPAAAVPSTNEVVTPRSPPGPVVVVPQSAPATNKPPDRPPQSALSVAPTAPGLRPPEAKPPAAASPPQTPPAADAARLSPVIFPIHEAAEVGDTEQVKALLKAWPELLEADNEKGLTPLHVAAAHGRRETAEALLARRANVHAKTRYGWVPLHFAATKGDAPTVALLLSYGARAQVKTRTDDTPLHMAARGGHLEVVKLLLQAHADPNVVEQTTGLTPLHLAANRGSLPMVELLVGAGANVNASDPQGDTPLTLALAAGHDNLIAHLQKHGAREPQGRLLTALEQSLVDYYRRLDQVFRTGSLSEKRKAASSLAPTRADAQKLFPKHTAEAVKVVEELQREIRATPDKDLGLAANEGEIWKLQPGPSSPYIRHCQQRGLIAADVPIFTLTVKKKGRKSAVDVYCFVNNHWVPLPPLARILPE